MPAKKKSTTKKKKTASPKKSRSKKVSRSAKSGRFVKKAYAKKHPSTTVNESVKTGTTKASVSNNVIRGETDILK